jgi:hypothetical protein
VPRALGGAIDDGIDVLCGSCNSERGQVTRREIQALRADGQRAGVSKIARAQIPPSEPRPARFSSVHDPEHDPERAGWFA